MIELIAAAIAGLAAGAVIGGAVTAWVLCRRNNPAKLLTVGSLIRYNGRVYEIELTVGSLIRYNGRVYEIERFTTDDDNQTIAHFGDEVWEYLIPVEELEAVTE